VRGRRSAPDPVSASWFIRRCLFIGYTLLVVSLLVFAITQVLPADAAVTLLGENATPSALAALRLRLGLNDPVWLQYWHWLSALLRGDFGISMRTGQPVGPMMFTALARSLLLAVLSLALMLAIAVPLGLAAALRRGGVVDVLAGLVSYLGVSLPEFVTGTLLLLLFADRMQWLPATGYVPLLHAPLDSLLHLVLPVLTVSLVMVAHVSRMVRSEMVDVLHSDYVRAARLKGLPARTVLFRHALRNALLPVITVVALDVGYLLGGIIVVEEIFAIPGIGRAIIVAIEMRDLPAIQAGALIMAGTYAVANFLADIAYALLDRRIRYD
jgi:peptide/nickel transport system permease protein